MDKKLKRKIRIAYFKIGAIWTIFVGVVVFLLYTVNYYPEGYKINNTESSFNLHSKEDPNEITFFMDFPEDLENKDTVLVTWYNPCESQCDSDPLVTADMSVIDLEELKNRDIRWIAISRDLLETYSMGDTVIIESPNQKVNGEWVIHDVMNKRFTKRIDLLVSEDDTHYELKMPKMATIKKV